MSALKVVEDAGGDAACLNDDDDDAAAAAATAADAPRRRRQKKKKARAARRITPTPTPTPTPAAVPTGIPPSEFELEFSDEALVSGSLVFVEVVVVSVVGAEEVSVAVDVASVEGRLVNKVE